jgi:hypothetical protein
VSVATLFDSPRLLSNYFGDGNRSEREAKVHEIMMSVMRVIDCRAGTSFGMVWSTFSENYK